MVWGRIMIDSHIKLQVLKTGTMMCDSYCTGVTTYHVRLFNGAIGETFLFMDDMIQCYVSNHNSKDTPGD